jgi:hypothetical protein
MGASDLIKTLQIHLARRVPSTYGSWIWSSATMSAGSGPITHRRTSPQSNIWRAICSEGRAGRIQYIFAERSRHGTMSSSPASSGRNSFARFACGLPLGETRAFLFRTKHNTKAPESCRTGKNRMGTVTSALAACIRVAHQRVTKGNHFERAIQVARTGANILRSSRTASAKFFSGSTPVPVLMSSRNSGTVRFGSK